MIDARTLPSLVIATPQPDKTLVRLSGGKGVPCGPSDTNAIGFTTRETFANDKKSAILLLSKQGTITARAAGAINPGDEVFNAASGKLDATGTVRRGIAVTGATEDDDWFEYLETAA